MNFERLKIMPEEKEKLAIPNETIQISSKLQKHGFEAFLVGGCVRDILSGKEPKDWDLTTNAKPKEIQKIFPNSFYENSFGTVGVKTESENPTLAVIEITPYRLEEKYTDKRHPDKVKFTDKLEDDLARRDFTINAIALSIKNENPKDYEIVDPFNGQKDLKHGIIRAVGDANERFNEDALRIIRAIRFVSEFNFSIEDKTKESLRNNADLLKLISKERIRDEFAKTINSDSPDVGLEIMRELGILKHVLPELEEGWGVTQNKEHIYTVWEHNIRALKHAAENKWPLKIRLSALLHDVGKPRTKKGEGHDSTFYGHDVVGGKITAQALKRLKFPNKIIEDVAKLVRWHLFFSDTEVITLSAVKRIIRHVGEENIWNLMKVRYCDRVGMSRPKERPFRLRKYESMIEEALRSPLSVTQLTVNGEDVIKIAKIEPGPKVGYILHILLEEVIEDESLNNREYQEKRVEELNRLDEKELQKMGEYAKNVKQAIEQKEVETIRKKYFVK